MNNNIKEILQSLKEHTWLEYEEMDKLSDYITNLQEENEKLNLYIEFYKSIIDKYKEVLDKIKEKGVMYYDQEYSKIYGELCSMPGANNTRTPVIVIDDEILELLEEIE